MCALSINIQRATLRVWETREQEHISVHGGLPSLNGGANPPVERREGDANVCYIFGVNPDRYLLGSPCWSVLSDVQGKT